MGNLDLFNGDNGFGRMSNVQDINLGYERWINGTKHYVMIAFHWLSLVESAGEDDLGIETDLVYAYNYSNKVATEFGYSFLTAGDALDQVAGGSADNIQRFWGQVRLRW